MGLIVTNKRLVDLAVGWGEKSHWKETLDGLLAGCATGSSGVAEAKI